MSDYLENPRCGDSNSSFSLEFSSDMNQMEGGTVGDKLRGIFGRSPSPTNLDFIANLDFVAISDPEGYDILTQAGRFEPAGKDKDKTLYVCGDLIDSTGDISGDRIKTKSHNIRNIMNCLKNENIHLIFGNRDLNKIKCKFLCVLDGNGQETKNFNNGNINLNNQTYLRLKDEFSEEKYKKPWKIHRMTHWYPFWNMQNIKLEDKKDKDDKILKDDSKLQKWLDENEYSKNFFLDRFNEIFGADTNVGTMGAQNLIHGIPYEIFGEESKSKLDDEKAFIVLAVFRSMLIGDNPYCYDFDGCSEEKNNSKFYKSLLVMLYKSLRSYTVKLLDDNKNTYILSHGGITTKLMDNLDSIKSLYKALNSTNNNVNKLKKLLTQNFQQNGGFIKNNVPNKNIEITKLIKKIKEIDEIYKKAITNVLNDKMDIPSYDMLFLLMTTAPYECGKKAKLFENITDKNITDKNYKQLEDKIKSIDCGKLSDILKATELFSPVSPGVNNMRNNMFTLKNRTLYQLIGHVPMGFGTIVDKFTSSNKQTSYLITLDNSNTFTGTEYNVVNEKSESFSMFKIDKGIPHISTEIKLNVINGVIGTSLKGRLSIQHYDTEKYNTELESNDNKVIHSTDYSLEDLKNHKLEIHQQIKDMTNLDLTEDITKITNDIKKITNDQVISYHGKTATGFNVLTHQIVKPGYFNKNLLILNDKDFNNFVDHVKKSSRQQIKNGLSNILFPFKRSKSSKSGGYQQKYLKYKQKYLQLKQMLEQQQ